MTTCFLAPDPCQSTFFIPGGAVPGNGVQVFFYVTNTSTKQTAYKDPAAATPWTNPIVLDSGGNLPSGASVWFPEGKVFTVKWCPSNDTDPPSSPYRTMDNISGVNDPSSIQVNSEWILGSVPIFTGANQFTIVGDQSLIYQVGRRIKAAVTAGFSYGTITSVNFGAGITTVTVDTTNSNPLDTGLSSVSYGLLGGTNPSVPPYLAGEIMLVDATDTKTVRMQNSTMAVSTGATLVVSNSNIVEGSLAPVITTGASNLSLNNITGDIVHYTVTSAASTFPISSITLNSGWERTIVFDQQNFIVSSAILITRPITTAAGDNMVVRGESGSTRVIDYNTVNPLSGIYGNSLVFIMASTAASSASIVLSSMAGFTNYKAFINNVLPTANPQPIEMRFSQDNGTTFFSSGSLYASVLISQGVNGTIYSASQNPNDQGYIVNASSNPVLVSGNNGMGINAEINIYNPGQTSSAKSLSYTGTYQGTTAIALMSGMIKADGTSINSSAVNAMKFSFSSSPFISSGVFSLYGIRNS